VRSRAVPASPSGVSSPRDPPRGEAEASPDDRSPHRVRTAPSCVMRDRSPARPPAATSRGFTGQGPEETKLRMGLGPSDDVNRSGGDFRWLSPLEARSRPPLRASGSESYPNPIHSDTSRHETVAAPDGDSGVAGAAPVREPRRRRSHHASPCPREGWSPRALDDPLARGRLRGLRSVLRRDEGPPPGRVACADTSGARAALLLLPRRSTRHAAPEVPSVGDPASSPVRSRPSRG
jgi:hypothetical protein